MNSATSPLSSTPILDLEAPLPAKHSPWDRLSLGRTLFVLVSLLASALLIVVVGFLLRTHAPAAARLLDNLSHDLDAFSLRAGPLIPLYFYLLYFLSAVACLTIHEAGHVAAALAVGFTFKKVRVGPLLVSRLGRGLKFSFQLRSRLSGLTVVHVPRKPKIRRRYLLYSFAGPFANFLTTLLVCLILTLSASSYPTAVIRVPLEFFAAYSLFVGATNLIPYLRRNGMFSDGGRLWGLLRSKAKTKRYLSLLGLTAQIETGKRLRALPQTWITHACAIPDRSSDALQSFLIAYLNAYDRENPQETAHYLELCLQRIEIASPEVKKVILVEAAVFHAWFRNDAQKAELWAGRSKAGPALLPLNQVRLRICMSWVHNRYEDVLADLEKGRALIEPLPESAAKIRLTEGWNEWKEKIDKQRVDRQAQTLNIPT
jgi:hypothetical protein